MFTMWTEGMFRTLASPKCLFQTNADPAVKRLLLGRKSEERAEVRREVEGDSLGKRRERKWTETERQV